MKPSSLRDLVVPALLLALGAIPTFGGALRLASFAGPVTSASARFFAAPAPIVVHVFAATFYCLIGAFQFSPAVRRRWPLGHRRTGKVLAVAGLATGLTGMWMAVAYRIPSGMQGPWLEGVRLAVGAAMVGAIVLGWRSIVRRDVARHEAWMVRAYALGQGAGTQAVLLLPWMLITGESEGPTRELLMTFAWALNAVVAEWIVRRAPRPIGAGVRLPIARR